MGVTRLVQHRDDFKFCQCTTCYLDINRLPPPLTKAEEIVSYGFEEREVKRAKRDAKRAVAQGSQKTIGDFFATTTKTAVQKKRKKTSARK
jgi:hypothetical protein